MNFDYIHCLTKDKVNAYFDDDDKEERKMEDVERREEMLDDLSVKVQKAEGVDAKIEVLTSQIEVMSLSLQLAVSNIETLIYAVNSLEKKNKKLKKQLKEALGIIEGHTEYMGTVPEKLFRVESRIKELEEKYV